MTTLEKRVFRGFSGFTANHTTHQVQRGASIATLRSRGISMVESYGTFSPFLYECLCVLLSRAFPSHATSAFFSVARQWRWLPSPSHVHGSARWVFSYVPIDPGSRRNSEIPETRAWVLR